MTSSFQQQHSYQAQFFFTPGGANRSTTAADAANYLDTYVHSLPCEQRIRSLSGLFPYQQQQSSSNTNNNNNNNSKATSAGQLILHESANNNRRRDREGNDMNSNINKPFTSIADVVGDNTHNTEDDDVDERIKIYINPEDLKNKNAPAATRNTNQTNNSSNHTLANQNRKFKIFRVSACEGGSGGKVHALAVDDSNSWFASGSSDGAVRAWDLVTGKLKFTFGSRHIGAVRGLAISSLSPYMFSCGEDKLIKCWDLERNEIIREYQGHLSAVYTVATHPRQDIVISGGRDASVRVWDIRTRSPVHILAGGGASNTGAAMAHTESVLTVATQEVTPQLVSGGADGLIYLWDLGSGRPITRMTRHKKPVRSLLLHPTENTLVSVGADAVRKWRTPVGEYMGCLSGSELLLNAETAAEIAGENQQQEQQQQQERFQPKSLDSTSNSKKSTTNGPKMDTVWSSASYSPLHDCFAIGSESNAGQLLFADWSSMKVFYETKTKSLPGTLPGESGILSCSFDKGGDFLLTGEGDKGIKHWKSKTVDKEKGAEEK